MLNNWGERLFTVIRDLCELHNNPNFAYTLKQLVAVLSDVQKTNLQEVSRFICQTVRSQPSPISSRKERFQRAFSRDSLRPDESLWSTLETWVSDPSRFLEGTSFAVLHGHVLSISTAYAELRRCDVRHAINTIQRRFLLVSLYDAVLRARYHNGSAWLPRARQELAERIATEVKETQDIVTKQLGLYVDYGRAFSLWAEELRGRYCLLLLPTDISEYL